MSNLSVSLLISLSRFIFIRFTSIHYQFIIQIWLLFVKYFYLIDIFAINIVYCLDEVEVPIEYSIQGFLVKEGFDEDEFEDDDALIFDGQEVDFVDIIEQTFFTFIISAIWTHSMW